MTGQFYELGERFTLKTLILEWTKLETEFWDRWDTKNEDPSSKMAYYKWVIIYEW